MHPLNIAIIGGGPAGLTLANLLTTPSDVGTKNTVNVTVFEHDVSASARTTKGGTLDLHADTGLAALGAAGLRPAFDAHARYDLSSGGMVFANRHGVRVLDMSEGVPHEKGEGEHGQEGENTRQNARPEIDRGDLKTILLDAIPKGTIQWGKHLSSISPENGTLVFADDTQETVVGKYDLVVGAEGAWSKVRAFITDTKPIYSGISGFELYIPHPDETHPRISKEVGGGLYIALGAGRAIIGQRQGSGAIMLYAMRRTPSATDPTDLIASCDGNLELVKERVVNEYEEAGFSEELCGWIAAADAKTLRGWPLYEYKLPDGHMFEHREGWTVIGDAAHVMTPFAGEGVNTGMRDALELARRVKETVQAPEGENRKAALDMAVREYEQEMFARARPAMTESYQNKLSQFEDGAPESLLERMREIMSGGPPPRDV